MKDYIFAAVSCIYQWITGSNNDNNDAPVFDKRFYSDWDSDWDLDLDSDLDSDWDWNEDRVDICGQNGNDGLHYPENK